MAHAGDVSMIDTLLNHAHQYATQGFEIFPVNEHTKSPYESQYHATTDADTITQWWQKWPSALIGHRISPMLIVLDVDPRHGGLDTWHALKDEMPAFVTRVHYSGRGDGGGHIWLQRPAEQLTIAKLDGWARDHSTGHKAEQGERWTCGIDLLRNEHRYTILPPSTHPETGNPYVWAQGQSATSDVAACPAYLCDLLIADQIELSSLEPAPAPARPAQHNSIADWYSQHTQWSVLLTRHGWTLVGGDGDSDGSRWRHPAATAAHSATIRHHCLFVYSSNTAFEITAPGDVHGYTPFAAYAVLEHGGDQSKAAREARRLKGSDSSSAVSHHKAQTPAQDTAPPPAFVPPQSASESTAEPSRLRVTERMRDRLATTEQILNMPEPTWLIDGILTADALGVIWGPPASGKSFCAIDWSLSISSGTWWFGHKVAAGDVLYVAAEGAAGLGKRVRAWMSARNVYGLSGVHWLPSRVNLLDPAEADAIFQIADELQPTFVIIDTLARSMVGGDENAAQDMSRVIDRCDQIKAATKSSVLLVHHSTKEESTMRGSSALKGAIDVEIKVNKTDSRVSIDCEKQKDADPFNRVQLQLVNSESSCVLSSVHNTAVDDEWTGWTNQQIDQLRPLTVNTIVETGLTGVQYRNMIEDELNVKRSRAYQLINVMLEQGYIENVGTIRSAFYVPGPNLKS